MISTGQQKTCFVAFFSIDEIQIFLTESEKRSLTQKVRKARKAGAVTGLTVSGFEPTWAFHY